jgi:hypothetical protein
MSTDPELDTAIAGVAGELSNVISSCRACCQASSQDLAEVMSIFPERRQREVDRRINSELSDLTGSVKGLEAKARTDAAVIEKRLADIAKEFRGEISKIKEKIRAASAPAPAPPSPSRTPAPPSPSPTPDVSVPSPTPDVSVPSVQQPSAEEARKAAEELEKTADARLLEAGALRTVTCPFEANKPLEGILNWLVANLHGNPHETKAVEVTGSSCLDPTRFLPQNAANPLEKNIFVSRNEANQWITYDFKQKRVQITHYSIRSRFDGFKGSNNLKDWVVEASLDGSEWTVIDSKTDNGELDNRNVTATWEVKSTEQWRFVRLRQTGLAHSGKNFLALSSFELFGELILQPQ